MEKEKEREMNALRKEKRELIHTQMVCGICHTVGFTNFWSLFNWCSFYCDGHICSVTFLFYQSVYFFFVLSVLDVSYAGSSI